MVKVLLAGDLFVTPEVLREALARHVPDAETSVLQGMFPDVAMETIGGVHEAVGDEDELIEALKGVDVCFTHTHPLSRRVIESSPSLKQITVTRGGPVNADKQAATDNGVALTFAPGRNATATTEHSVGMILAAARQIAQRHHELVTGVWRGDYYRYELVGPELHGATVGLVGYGAIGSRVALILQAIGMKVRVFDPYLNGSLPEGIEHVAHLDDLLASADVLTIHARQTEETMGLIGAREIALMPKGSILVNCARPGLLDYDALCDALDSEHLYAAACDVLPAEPLAPDHRILHTPKLTVTPHLAGASKQAAHLAAEIGAADIAAFVRGERPKHLANPEVLEK